MSCDGTTYFADAADVAWKAVSNAEFVDALSCTFANPFGGFIVFGTAVWFTVSTMSYIRTGSFAMPIVFTFLLGGAALQQVVAPALGFASVLILGGFALAAVLVARRLDRL